eukprot:COSAG05_NODE_14341_length_399_cov_1.543333_2_plen_37_part_01
MCPAWLWETELGLPADPAAATREQKLAAVAPLPGLVA